MRSISSYIPARRARRLLARRARRRPVLIAAGVGAAALTLVGFAGAVPVSRAEASGISSFALVSYATSAEPVVTIESASHESATDAEEALDAAEAAVAAAASVTSDITASGVDIGVAQPTVDVTELEESADRLELAIDSLPAMLLADVVDDVTDEVTTVGAQVASLRGSLDGALAAKAQREAEEKARAEAEAAAKAAAAAAEAEAEAEAEASSSSSSSWMPSAAIPGGYGAGDNSPAGAQAYAYSRFGAFGWGGDQFGCLVALWDRESGWNYQAHNSSSGAHGIPQALPGSKMSSAGADWQTNAATQVEWGLGYVASRYGTPCSAWSHSESVGWY